MLMDNFDYEVIGGGSAGSSGAIKTSITNLQLAMKTVQIPPRLIIQLQQNIVNLIYYER